MHRDLQVMEEEYLLLRTMAEVSSDRWKVYKRLGRFLDSSSVSPLSLISGTTEQTWRQLLFQLAARGNVLLQDTPMWIRLEWIDAA